MKIALTSAGETSGSEIDSRFGRAKKLMIYDLENRTSVFIDNNQNLNASQGAGIQSAGNVVESGAEVLITGHCGPKAFRVLNAAGIEIFLAEKMTLEEAVEKYKKNELKKICSADVEGHWQD